MVERFGCLQQAALDRSMQWLLMGGGHMHAHACCRAHQCEIFRYFRGVDSPKGQELHAEHQQAIHQQAPSCGWGGSTGQHTAGARRHRVVHTLCLVNPPSEPEPAAGQPMCGLFTLHGVSHLQHWRCHQPGVVAAGAYPQSQTVERMSKGFVAGPARCFQQASKQGAARPDPRKQA